MKKIAWLLLMGIAWGSMAQINSGAFGDINGAGTDAHINIPGTKLYMIMPPGFKLMPGTTCYRRRTRKKLFR